MQLTDQKMLKFIVLKKRQISEGFQALRDARNAVEQANDLVEELNVIL